MHNEKYSGKLASMRFSERRANASHWHFVFKAYDGVSNLSSLALNPWWT
jgi:hypothetical protein